MVDWLRFPFPDQCTFYPAKNTSQIANCLGKILETLSTRIKQTSPYLEEKWLQFGSIKSWILLFTISFEERRYWLVWNRYLLDRFCNSHNGLWSFLTFADLISSAEIPGRLRIQTILTKRKTRTRVEMMKIFNRLAESTVWTCLIDREILKFLFPWFFFIFLNNTSFYIHSCIDVVSRQAIGDQEPSHVFQAEILEFFSLFNTMGNLFPYGPTNSIHDQQQL